LTLFEWNHSRRFCCVDSDFFQQTGTGGLEVLLLSNFLEKQNWGLFFIVMAVDHPTLIVTLCEVEVGGFTG
jgi:hypothetical protein